MKTKFKVLTGTAEQVENDLNKLEETYNGICIMGMSATDESTTVVVQIFLK